MGMNADPELEVTIRCEPSHCEFVERPLIAISCRAVGSLLGQARKPDTDQASVRLALLLPSTYSLNIYCFYRAA